MRATDDATVRRDDMMAALRFILPRSRKPAFGSVEISPGAERATLTFRSDFGADVTIPADGPWLSRVIVPAAMVLPLFGAKLPMRLRLTFFGNRLMVGPTALPAHAAPPPAPMGEGAAPAAPSPGKPAKQPAPLPLLPD